MNPRLEAAPEICNMNLQYENIASEIGKIFNTSSNDYSKEHLFDVWVTCMHLHLETMPDTNEESKLVFPCSLTSLWIGSCTITNDALSTCLKSLVFLSEIQLTGIQTITSLPPREVLSLLRNLRSLTIRRCLLLSSLGGIGALTSLTELILGSCINLSASNEPFPFTLEKLEFWYCINVDVMLARSHLPVLRVLLIGNIVAIRKGVLHVGHLPSLEQLSLYGWSDRLEGLNSLASLHTLRLIDPCPENFLASPVDKYSSPLQKVSVTNPLQLKLMLSDETISSIETFGITNFDGNSLDDEVFHSLTFLKTLVIFHCKITHLPPNMKNLPCLQYMLLQNCPNLRELEYLPHNLREIDIEDCPILVEKFKKGDPNYRVQFEEGSTIVTFLTEEERNQVKL